MAVKAFHHSLKVCYFDKKQNRRIDMLLHVLLKIARDKVFERVLKTQKGKMTHRLSEINKRHKLIDKLKGVSQITPLNDTSWNVSSSNGHSTYTVTKVMVGSCSCQLRCRTCGVFVHDFTCTCIDFIVHATVCKHIHFIKLHLNSTIPTTSEDLSPSIDLNADMQHAFAEDETVQSTDKTTEIFSVSSVEYLSKCLQRKPTPTCTCTSARNRATSLCKKIEVALLNCTNMDAIRTGIKHLNAAYTVISAMDSRVLSDGDFPTRKRVAPNANFEKQTRFKSTKKPRTLSRKSLSTPNDEEKSQCIDNLDEVDITVCSICLREEDKSGNRLVEWIECDKCTMWFHKSYVVNDDDDVFICQFCSN